MLDYGKGMNTNSIINTFYIFNSSPLLFCQVGGVTLNHLAWASKLGVPTGLVSIINLNVYVFLLEY